MLGGIGLIIAALLLFGWRRDAIHWKRIIAWIAGIWAGVSILFYIFVFLTANY